jgi:hypothetical protein
MNFKLFLKNTFKSPVTGTFVGTSVFTALIILLLYSFYVQNNYDDSNVKIVGSLYTSTHGLALSIFTPIVLGLTTSLLIKYFIGIRSLLIQSKILRALSFGGLFLAYFGASFMSVSVVFYFA